MPTLESLPHRSMELLPKSPSPTESATNKAQAVSNSTIPAGGSSIEARPPAALKLVPISPETFRRYTRQRTIIKRDTEYIVPRLCRSFSPVSVPNWIAERHPEGGLHFVHAEHRIFTDAYLYDSAPFVQITSAVAQLLARAEVQQLLSTDSNHIDIVLDLMTESLDNDECGYYLVDHSARIIFWLEAFNMSALDNWNQIPGISTPTHAKLCLEIEYWVHCEYFPTAMPISPQVVGELHDAIMYGIGDAMSSLKPTQQFPIERLFRMLTLTKEMVCEPVLETADSTRFKMNPGSVAVFARFMHDFAVDRFYNFHGEKTARLNNDESVYGSIPQRSHPVAWLSALLLFNVPLRYLQTLQVVNTDHLINYASWQRFITTLRTEWLDIVLYGTLILNTNVGFLSVPASGLSTAGQVASYASICFGITSIILGILLLRTYQVEAPDVQDLTQAAQLFYNHGTSAYGLEVWAVVLSLPFALTIWAMITFILAFLITIIETSGSGVRWIMVATVFIVSLALVSFVWTQKRFVWMQSLVAAKTRMKHSTSLMYESWLPRRPSRNPAVDSESNICSR
ncbi:hypothetical protein C8R45DRAFT_1012733 [Mycena sanguinolenta]|nr:hypothetical protein C8R45DRAFT_1012733 [Mycena sanguinolenta]